MRRQYGARAHLTHPQVLECAWVRSRTGSRFATLPSHTFHSLFLGLDISCISLPKYRYLILPRRTRVTWVPTSKNSVIVSAAPEPHRHWRPFPQLPQHVTRWSTRTWLLSESRLRPTTGSPTPSQSPKPTSSPTSLACQLMAYPPSLTHWVWQPVPLATPLHDLRRLHSPSSE